MIVSRRCGRHHVILNQWADDALHYKCDSLTCWHREPPIILLPSPCASAYLPPTRARCSRCPESLPLPLPLSFPWPGQGSPRRYAPVCAMDECKGMDLPAGGPACTLTDYTGISKMWFQLVFQANPMPTWSPGLTKFARVVFKRSTDAWRKTESLGLSCTPPVYIIQLHIFIAPEHVMCTPWCCPLRSRTHDQFPA